MESYGYRLTHDPSLDTFKSEDLFLDDENKTDISSTCVAYDKEAFLKSVHASISSSAINNDDSEDNDHLTEEMITLNLEDNVNPNREIIPTDPEDETSKLLYILEQTKSADERQGLEEHGEENRKEDAERRVCEKENGATDKQRRNGRKLPEMPKPRPGSLELDIQQILHEISSSSTPSPPPTNHSDVWSQSSTTSSPYRQNGSTTSLPYTLNHQNVNSTSNQFMPFLSNTNMLLREDSSPEEMSGASSPKHRSRKKLRDEGGRDHPYYQPITLVINGEVKVQTHKAIFRFTPRHDDELAMDVGDPIYVEEACEDRWCEGVNLRTGEDGCFPDKYARIYSIETETEPGQKAKRFHLNRYKVHFLGSVETPMHKGNEVLCRAMQKVVTARKMLHNNHPPTVCVLEISDHGVKMIDLSTDKSSQKKDSVRKKVERFLSGRQNQSQDYYFSLKNVSFCGYHPACNRYFGFITKHPTERRFACHVFTTHDNGTAKPIAEAMGKAFRRFYSEFLDFTNPTEDIYME